MNESRTPQLLRAAADLIATDGYCQNTGRGWNGKRCTFQALADAATAMFPNEQARALGELSRACGALAKYAGITKITEWNDADGRTEQEVIGLLRDIADWSEGRAPQSLIDLATAIAGEHWVDEMRAWLDSESTVAS